MAKTWNVVQDGKVVSTMTCTCPEPSFYKGCKDDLDPECPLHHPPRARAMKSA